MHCAIHAKIVQKRHQVLHVVSYYMKKNPLLNTQTCQNKCLLYKFFYGISKHIKVRFENAVKILNNVFVQIVKIVHCSVIGNDQAILI